MPLTVERKVPLILLFVVVILTGLGFVLYQYTASLHDAVTIERRTKDTIQNLDALQEYILDIESAVNNFVLTGNDSYLDPYRKAKVGIPQKIAQIRPETDDSAAEVDELGRLENYTADYIAQAEARIEKRKTTSFEESISSYSISSNRAVLGNIRASVEWLKSTELTNLETRENQLDETFWMTISVLIVGCVLGMIALALANLTVSREIGKRRTAESALLDANRDLERRIEKRTVELEKANASLRSVASERETLLENEQEARREAEIANRLRDEFMAMVSHELKTPLNSILGWARMLKEGELDEAQAKKALSTIIKNSEMQNRLLEDLLDVARVISGKLVLELEDVDPVELVRDAVESALPAASAKSISLSHTSAEGAEQLRISGDRNRLTQIFSNLLTNAVKFTPEGGSIKVEVSAGESEVNVRVRDNGVGISPDFLPSVFDRFRQDAAVTSGNGGLGLGLAIARQLVEMHGGSISARSDGAGKGSEFTVTLPARQQADHRQAHRA